MAKRGNLPGPVVGVAKQGWKLRAIAGPHWPASRSTLVLDEAAFAKLNGLLRYVDGDYNDPATFAELRQELGRPRNRLTTWRFRPVLFGTVVEQLGVSHRSELPASSSRNPSAAIWPPPSRSNQTVHEFFPESSIFRIDHYLGKTPVQNLLFFRFSNDISSRSGTATRRERADHDGRGVRRAGPRPFYEEAGAIRDVIQNHLLQIVAHIAMEPPAGTDSESIRDEKVKVFKAIPPLDADNIVRGQFRGYRDEKGVAPDSQVETFAARPSRSIPGAGRTCRS